MKFDELVKVVDKIRPYYDIDKIKSYAVYIWSKDREFGDNVFDIHADKIVIYDEEHSIPIKALPIILEIQNALKEINNNA